MVDAGVQNIIGMYSNMWIKGKRKKNQVKVKRNETVGKMGDESQFDLYSIRLIRKIEKNLDLFVI